MTAAPDILGLGCVAVDDLLYVAAYPPADTKMPIRRRDRQCGGLTATALVAASRLGARCAYAGTLGTGELSGFVVERLRQEGMDVSAVRVRPDAQPIHSFIVVDEERLTRTIFYDLEGVYGAEPGWPDPAVIRASRVLYVDQFGVEGMTWAARIAREAGRAVVADFERGEMPGFDVLLGLADHLIVSRAFAARLTGLAEPASAATQLWTAGRKVVVVTDGAAGCWYVSVEHPEQPRHQPAFAVAAVDTTGCGDVFHGAYAAALVHGLDVVQRVRFAAAAAALKATRRGGQAGIPDRSTVEAFLEGNSP
jgi:sugar/nucleoside kinase (ribokinase family)